MNKSDIEAAFAKEITAANTCTIGRLVKEHEHGEVIRDKVDKEVLYSAAMIARVLKNLGLPPVSASAIVKHRRGECKCPVSK